MNDNLDSAYAINFFHDKNIIHGNIKLNNIFICQNKNGLITAKLGGFGINYYLDQFSRDNVSIYCNDKYLKLEKINNIQYMAPELLLAIYENKEVQYTKKSDNYAFAIVINEIFNCKKPFINYTYKQYIDDVVNKKKRPGIFIPNNECESKLKKLINGNNINYYSNCCDNFNGIQYYLEHDPNNRPYIEAISDILDDYIE